MVSKLHAFLHSALGSSRTTREKREAQPKTGLDAEEERNLTFSSQESRIRSFGRPTYTQYRQRLDCKRKMKFSDNI